jgi:uncharacterized protein YggE
MNRSHKILASVGVILTVLAVVVVPTLAQSNSGASAGYPENSITVIGTGTVHSTPDIATVDVGVDVTKPTVSEGFSEANSKVQDIITALTGLGIAAEDIQTSNLSVYSTTNPNPQTNANETGYTVSNTVHVIVRDVTKVESVIDAAIKAGATSLYGLSFDIQDRSALEEQARELAIKDAQARGENYATLINAKLGDVIIINETPVGGTQPSALYSRQGIGGGGGAVVAPGQTDVQIQVSVTYSISH